MLDFISSMDDGLARLLPVAYCLAGSTLAWLLRLPLRPGGAGGSSQVGAVVQVGVAVEPGAAAGPARRPEPWASLTPRD